jgi:hypothetical protein
VLLWVDSGGSGPVHLTSAAKTLNLINGRSWRVIIAEYNERGACDHATGNGSGLVSQNCLPPLSERRPDRVRVISLIDGVGSRCVNALPFYEKLLKSPRRDSNQQHARFRAAILKGMLGSARHKHNGPGRCAHDAIAELKFEFSTQDVKELIIGPVDMEGWPAFGCNRLSKQAERSSGLLSCEPLAKLSARVREFPARITALDRNLVISSESRHICRRATSFQSFQASR